LQRACIAIRRDRHNRTALRSIANEPAAFDAIARANGAFGIRLAVDGDEASVALRP
jgi:hypothetical protein